MGLSRYDRSRVDGAWLDRDQARSISETLLGLDYMGRAGQPCVGRDRADLVVAGCAILESIFDIWPAERLGIADRGIREGILCIAQFGLLRPLSAAAVAPEVIWLSVLNATLCTFAPVIMVMMAIERIGSGLAAQTGMIGPMSTIVMGVWILDEPFNRWIVAGTVLVLGGVFLVTRFGSAPKK